MAGVIGQNMGFKFKLPPGFQQWDGTAGINVDLVAGEGVELRPSAPADVIVVGSHDPHIKVPEGGLSCCRDYLISIPDHSSTHKADDLLRVFSTGCPDHAVDSRCY